MNVNPLLLCGDEDHATNFALAWLRDRGFSVSRPDCLEMITPSELRERHAPHLTASGIYLRLNHDACPWFDAKRGPSGRIIALVPNPQLLQWISAPRSQGRSLERKAA